MLGRAIFIIGVTVTTVTPASASTLHVPTEYGTIQAAVNAAAAGDTVLVAPGVYTDCDGGPCLPKIVVMREGIVLLSEAGPGATTLRADNPAGTGYVIEAHDLGPLEAEIRGFRIISTVAGREGFDARGSQRITVRECWFEDFVRGVSHATGFPGDYSLKVIDCALVRCGGGSAGLGLYVLDVDVTVEGCLFDSCVGGGLRWLGSDTQTGTVRNCTFWNTTGGSAVSAKGHGKRDCRGLPVRGQHWDCDHSPGRRERMRRWGFSRGRLLPDSVISSGRTHRGTTTRTTLLIPRTCSWILCFVAGNKATCGQGPNPPASRRTRAAAA